MQDKDWRGGKTATRKFSQVCGSHCGFQQRSNASFPFSWHDSLDVGKVYDRLRVKVVTNGVCVRARARALEEKLKEQEVEGKKLGKSEEKENC